jgi:unsaturated chondroitin disaccharide hydrolase
MENSIKGYEKWIDEVWSKLDQKLSKIAIKSREKLPYTTINGVHTDMLEKDVAWWTNGFWGGMMWLMYVGSGNEEYRITAERCEELLDKAFEKTDSLHHDVGFMWNLTSGANFRLTGNKKSKNRFNLASAILASRYNIDGGFIRAWPTWNEDNTGVTIIDCMMNIPMLYRATEFDGDNRFCKIAMSHADMTMAHHIREDGSVYHIVVHNPDTGEINAYRAGQGYSTDSAWSRGQAWAVYGFILSYIHTKEKRYLDTAKKAARFFVENVIKTDYMPLCDFKSPDSPVIYDSTAGVCAACGLIEIAKAVPDMEKQFYMESAMKILMETVEKCCNWDDGEDSILQMGTEAYTRGIHMPIIYGDFFLVEAMLKLKGNDFLIW